MTAVFFSYRWQASKIQAKANVKLILNGRGVRNNGAGKTENLRMPSSSEKINKLWLFILFLAMRSPRRIRLTMEWLFWLGGFRGRRTKVENILVVRLDRLGDLIMTSGFLRALREDFPAAKIFLAVRTSLEPLGRLCPDVDEVIGLPASDSALPSQRDEWQRTLSAWLIACWKKQIWQRRFDLAIVPRRDVDNNGAVIFAYLSGASERIGFSEDVNRNKASVNANFDSLLTRIVSDNCEGHEILSLGRLREQLGKRGSIGLVPWVVPSTRLAAESLLNSAGLKKQHVLMVVCLGAGAPNRCWPVEQYAELLNAVTSNSDLRILTIGTVKESPLGVKLKSLLGPCVINFEGVIPIEILPALVEKCSLYVGADTGPMHIAAAAGLPVLEISCHALASNPAGPNSPVRFGPWRVPARIVQPAKTAGSCTDVCQADAPHCILGNNVELAKVALEELVQECGLAAISGHQDASILKNKI
jgi:heptosyltransferase-2